MQQDLGKGKSTTDKPAKTFAKLRYLKKRSKFNIEKVAQTSEFSSIYCPNMFFLLLLQMKCCTMHQAPSTRSASRLTSLHI